MKNSIFYVLLSIGLLFSTSIKGQVYDGKELELKIDSLIPAAVNDTTPGLVIGIVQNGALIFSKGYGLANLAYGIPNDPKLVYNIGSVSKQFLGYAFAMLAEEGSLDLDDPVSKYLEDWPVFEHTVTLRHLLSHTSGYREAYTMSNLAGRYIGVDRLSREECLNVVRKQPELEYIPGSRFTYNSTAWVILAEVFEKVKGQSAAEWVKSNLFDPLGMEDAQIETYVGEVMENSAESYSLNDENGYKNEESNRAIFGAAEVYVNIYDLAKWINNYKTAAVGGKDVSDVFLDPYILNDGSNSEYALGITNGTYRGLTRYGHTGGHEAFSTQLSYYPEADLGIIVISNFGGRGSVPSRKIVDIILKNRLTTPEKTVAKGIKISKKKLEQFTGRYLKSTLNRTIEVTIVNDSLTIDGNRVLIPVDQHTFSNKAGDAFFEIETLPNGKTRISSSSSNGAIVYNQIDPWTPKIENLDVYEGDYWSDELETVYRLVLKDEKLSIHHRWIGEVSLEPITKDIFKSEWGYYLKFNRNVGGDISGLSMYSGRTFDVKFRKRE